MQMQTLCPDRYSLKTEDHLDEHTETVSPETVSAVWQGSKVMIDNDVPWAAVLQLIHDKYMEVPIQNVPAVKRENIKAQ